MRICVWMDSRGKGTIPFGERTGGPGNSPCLNESQKKPEISGFGLRGWTRVAEKVCLVMTSMRLDGMRRFERRARFEPRSNGGNRTTHPPPSLDTWGHRLHNARHRSQNIHHSPRPHHNSNALPRFLLRGFRHSVPGFPISFPPSADSCSEQALLTCGRNHPQECGILDPPLLWYRLLAFPVSQTITRNHEHERLEAEEGGL